MTDYNQPCSDSVTITDSQSRIVAYIKNISEIGLVPMSTLYPSVTLEPLTSILFYDECSNLPGKNLSDSFTSVDVIGPYTIGKGLQDSVSISDMIIKTFVKYLSEQGGCIPENSLYPAIDLYPDGGIEINDAVRSGFFRLLVDSFTVSDVISSFDIGKYSSEFVSISDYNTKSVGKYLNEFGTLPEITLYPSNDFYPAGGISITDVMGLGFFRSLSDSFNINDVDGINLGIGKGLSENITIFDIILFNIGLYFKENTNILDEILKGVYKPLSDTFMIEDNIVKNIAQLLSEFMIIDDEIETLLRTLVRAALKAIKTDQSILRAI